MQYGETANNKKRVIPESAKTRRARRDAQARERLRAIMTPDDDLLRRLARAGVGAPLPENGVENGSAKNGTHTRVQRRPRKWESRCGKCGIAAVFKAAAGVCARCGAIAVRCE